MGVDQCEERENLNAFDEACKRWCVDNGAEVP